MRKNEKTANTKTEGTGMMGNNKDMKKVKRKNRNGEYNERRNSDEEGNKKNGKIK